MKRRHILAAAAAISLVFGVTARADSPAGGPAGGTFVSAVVADVAGGTVDNLLEHRTLVLRVSKGFIRRHTPAIVDQQTPISRCLFGARVTGVATTNGHPVMKPHGDRQQSVLELHFQGTIDTRTVATKGPARVSNAGQFQFDVRREISFDGLDFRKGERTIDVSMASRTTGVSGPPGLCGPLVRSVASRRAASHQPAADAIARREMTEAVLAAFSERTDKLVADLNANLPWKETVSLLTRRVPGRRQQFSNKPKWIEARSLHVDFGDGEMPEAAASLRAPIELWVKGEPRASITERLLGLWEAPREAFARLRPAAPAAESGDDTSAEDAARGITPEMIGDWWVIRIGNDVADTILRPQTSPAAAAP